MSQTQTYDKIVLPSMKPDSHLTIDVKEVELLPGAEFYRVRIVRVDTCENSTFEYPHVILAIAGSGIVSEDAVTQMMWLKNEDSVQELVSLSAFNVNKLLGDERATRRQRDHIIAELRFAIEVEIDRLTS